MRSGHVSQRETRLGARVLYACWNDTTSELYGGNAIPGSPVKATMSGEAIRNQGGTVEYFCIPPLIFQGMGLFLYLPHNWEM